MNCRFRVPASTSPAPAITIQRCSVDGRELCFWCFADWCLVCANFYFTILTSSILLSTVPNHRQLIFRKATRLSPSSLLSTIALAWFSWSDFMSCCIALFCMPYQMFMLRLYMCLIGCHLTLSMSDLYALNCLLFVWFLIWSAFLGHWPSFGQHCLVLSSYWAQFACLLPTVTAELSLLWCNLVRCVDLHILDCMTWFWWQTFTSSCISSYLEIMLYWFGYLLVLFISDILHHRQAHQFPFSASTLLPFESSCIFLILVPSWASVWAVWILCGK